MVKLNKKLLGNLLILFALLLFVGWLFYIPATDVFYYLVQRSLKISGLVKQLLQLLLPLLSPLKLAYQLLGLKLKNTFGYSGFRRSNDREFEKGASSSWKDVSARRKRQLCYFGSPSDLRRAL